MVKQFSHESHEFDVFFIILMPAIIGFLFTVSLVVLFYVWKCFYVNSSSIYLIFCFSWFEMRIFSRKASFKLMLRISISKSSCQRKT